MITDELKEAYYGHVAPLYRDDPVLRYFIQYFELPNPIPCHGGHGKWTPYCVVVLGYEYSCTELKLQHCWGIITQVRISIFKYTSWSAYSLAHGLCIVWIKIFKTFRC